MDIQLDKKSATEASIKITLNEADYQPKVEEKIKDYRRKATIKGFRPGKVPEGMIRKMYGKAIMVEEINNLLSQSVNDYIKENKLKILGDPLPNTEEAEKIDWDNQKEFTFIYDIGVAGDFSVELSDKIKVDAYEIEVGDKVMNETMDNLKQQFGKMTNPEASEAGDLLYGTIKSEDSSIEETGTIAIDDIAEKEQKKFIGLKKDDTVSFDIQKTFKDEAAIAQATGKTEEEAKELNGTFTLTVQNVNRREPAELNQELFDKVFGKDAVKSEEEFIKKVEETIAENYNREAENYTNQKIQETLLDSTTIELPDEFLKRWLIVANQGKVTAADVEREYDLYTKDLRWNLITNRISEENDIKVEHEDVMDSVKDMIRQQLAGSGLSGMEDNLDAFAQNYIQGENGQNYMKVHTQVRTQKVMDAVREKIKLEKKKISADEFRNMLA
ncbi:trigger factor [Nafulsella turpanensis]|uniref:trigger factor n=1 Tax=Nafulsella turpanensis TaxID=1265690 RepID=UPI00034793B2|nr:trigger factor [Nafulsella turpanensis]